MRIHPAAERFPLMSGPDFDELVRDIRVHGLRDPIVTYEGAILDGRNRFRACEAAGVEPATAEWDGAGLSPFQYVWSKNGARRQLPAGQKAAIRVQLLTDHEEWRRREEAADTRRRSNLVPAGAKPKSSMNSLNRHDGGSSDEGALDEGSAAVVAREAGVSKRTAERAVELAKRSPEKLDDVASGKLPLGRAVEESKEQNKRLSGEDEDAPPKAPCDSLGRPIPKDRLKEWGAVARAVAAVDGHLKQAQREWTAQAAALDELSKESRLVARFVAESKQLMKGLGGDVLQKFSGRLRELAPFAVCLNCNGAALCPGKKCKRIRLAGAGAGTCNCKNKLCGECDGTGVVTAKSKAATKHDAKKAS